VLEQIVKEGGGESGAAALLLGDVGDPQAVAPLAQALEDPVCVAQKELIAALGKLHSPQAADAAGKFLYSDSPDVRAAAASALAQLGPGTHAEALDGLKGDYYLRVREAATAALQKAAPEGKR
jgi:HEAT repeat protein